MKPRSIDGSSSLFGEQIIFLSEVAGVQMN